MEVAWLNVVKVRTTAGWGRTLRCHCFRGSSAVFAHDLGLSSVWFTSALRKPFDTRPLIVGVAELP